MCGISAIITHNKLSDETLERFTNAIKHRGPDGAGIAKFAITDTVERLNDDSESYFIGLGHRRLSILDLSDAGAQPMTSADGSSIISYNGEVYNYIELRQLLEKRGITFKSNCDTEVVLAAYQVWGTECFKRFNGMWSIVILDRLKRELIVSRDRLGIKPLYFYQKNGTLAFGSEIKQFFHLPGFSKEVNIDAAVTYLSNGYEIPPETFFKNITLFPPAHFAKININKVDLDINPIRFWDPSTIQLQETSQDQVLEQISFHFSNAVKLRMRSDVPVGGCLSGGLDSSSIFVDMGAIEPNINFSAFSACFDDKFSDEREFMKEIIDITNTTHHKVFPTNDDFTNDFDSLLTQHDEPVGSVSIYAQYQVMKMASEMNIPVLLDGQGGDELFSGYWQTYFLLLDSFRKKGSFAKLAKHLGGASMPFGNYQLISESFAGISEFRKRSNQKFEFEIDEKLITNLTVGSNSYSKIRGMSSQEYRIYQLVDLHLPRLLKWEDRNSMAFSIESRVPFLDINLIEYILSVPPEMNMKNGWTKYLFRKSMKKRLPSKITWRKDKKGFETPQEKWMKNGAFNKELLKWSQEKNHLVSDLITTKFSEIHNALKSKSFDSNSMFRLYCLDKWMSKL